MKKFIAFTLLLALSVCLLLGASGCAKQEYGLNKNKPVTISIWHYYNGAQKQKFDEMVAKFNETVGAEKGIIVEAFNQGNVNELIDKVMDAANHKVGADEIPDIFAAYADTAYSVDKMELLADLSPYLTQEEKDSFVSAYLAEGQFSSKEEIKIFPIAKSTELFLINATDWNKFKDATGASEESFKTWEGVTKISKEYYEYTDALTPNVPDDGKSFFGRDSFANFMLIGSMQLGTELFQVQDGQVSYHVDEAVMRKFWDNYYVPFISGHFASYGKFRSDDVKTGDIIALVGSTSGATYFPTEVTKADGSTYEIEALAFPVPNFENTEPYAVQQGAGMAVTKSDSTREYAATVFLKWFTSKEQSLEFGLGSGYLPVLKELNSSEVLESAIASSGDNISKTLQSSLLIGAQTVQNNTLYTNKAFAEGNSARSIVETSLPQKAAEDLAAVDALVAGGMSRKDAVAQYNTEENFAAWLAQFKKELAALS